MKKIVEKVGGKKYFFFLITNNLVQVPEIVGEMRCKNSVKFQFVPARHQKIGRKVKKMNKKSIKNKKK